MPLSYSQQTVAVNLFFSFLVFLFFCLFLPYFFLFSSASINLKIQNCPTIEVCGIFVYCFSCRYLVELGLRQLGLPLPKSRESADHADQRRGSKKDQGVLKGTNSSVDRNSGKVFASQERASGFPEKGPTSGEVRETSGEVQGTSGEVWETSGEPLDCSKVPQ